MQARPINAKYQGWRGRRRSMGPGQDMSGDPHRPVPDRAPTRVGSIRVVSIGLHGLVGYSQSPVPPTHGPQAPAAISDASSPTSPQKRMGELPWGPSNHSSAFRPKPVAPSQPEEGPHRRTFNVAHCGAWVQSHTRPPRDASPSPSPSLISCPGVYPS